MAGCVVTADFVLFVIAVVAIVYAFWYDSERARARRAERDFVRRHRVAHRTDAPHFTRDPSPSPRRLSDHEWRAIAEGDAQR